MINFLKNLLIIGIVIGFMRTVGGILDAYMEWDYFTILFAVLRDLAELFDFMNDTDVMWEIVGYSLLLEITIWGAYGIVYLVRSSGMNKS